MARNIKFLALTLSICILICFTACNPDKAPSETEEKPKADEINIQNQQNNAIDKFQEYRNGALPDKLPDDRKSSTPTAPAEATILGKYETRILDFEENRINNIRLAIGKINNYIVSPGETFSFNEVIGERNSKRGFRKATIIIKNKKARGTGGGICQVSTTLYQAVKDAGLQIVERHMHTKNVYYVPFGEDATVVYGAQDFKFKNTKSYPVKIKASVGNGKVTVSIVKSE